MDERNFEQIREELQQRLVTLDLVLDGLVLRHGLSSLNKDAQSSEVLKKASTKVYEATELLFELEAQLHRKP